MMKLIVAVAGSRLAKTSSKIIIIIKILKIKPNYSICTQVLTDPVLHCLHVIMMERGSWDIYLSD